MKGFLRLAAICLLSVICISVSYAASDDATHQVTMTVNEVVLIGLNNTGTITLTTTAPANGGENPTGSSDATKRIQYTSLVATGTTRTITINWGGTDAAPAGTHLAAQASAVPGGCGTAVGSAVTVSGTGQNIVTAIPSCATGTGANGTTLTYTFVIDTVGSLVVGDSETVTITLTSKDMEPETTT
jgi:hypothetical protein